MTPICSRSFAPDLKPKGPRPRPPGHVPACAYGCCWKLPGESWAEAKKKWRPPPKGRPPMPPGNRVAFNSRNKDDRSSVR
jgi:hypothetical protein